jgi:5-(aminomethyl)-3-furanmethanol phosphate kinase
LSGFRIGTVIKVGGAFIEDPPAFAVLVDSLASLLTRGDRRAVLVVPGGGPFADTVRSVERRLTAGDDAAHWMAILAMEQHAHLLAARIGVADVVETVEEAHAAYDGDRLPVLAPYRWLRSRDSLPHSWAVTSDSIAAWIAIELAAPELVLVKSTPGSVEALTDPYFATVLAGATPESRPRIRVSGPDLTILGPSLRPGSLPGEHILTCAG